MVAEGDTERLLDASTEERRDADAERERMKRRVESLLVKPSAIPGYSYRMHEDACECELCEPRVRGAHFYIRYYSFNCRRGDELRQHFTRCLTSWLHLPWWNWTKPEVFGYAGAQVLVGGQTMFVHRCFVVLPIEVDWRRIWEKMLFSEDGMGSQWYLAALPLVREYIEVVPRTSWTRNGFVEYWRQCCVDIVYDESQRERVKSEGERFGDVEAAAELCYSHDKHLVGRL